MIKNLVLHFNLVNKHRFKVFKLCCKAGIPFRGLLHDLSKYSPTEFFESVKYYEGSYSPITNCKKENGYSKAWLHHKGRNKHHYEYWYDYSDTLPEKFVKALIEFEDHRFYSHCGVSATAIGRAILQNIRNGHYRKNRASLPIRQSR